MKKLLFVSLLAIMSLVAVQGALAYNFDVHRAYDDYGLHRQTSGQLGVGHHMETSWTHNGEYSGTITRDVAYSADHGCITRKADTNFDFENYPDRERHRTTTYGCC